jgi:RNA polymerase sigma factor (sigma-70 family)
VIGRFRGFPRAEVEDAFSFALEKGLQNLCREENEASIGAWLHKVMLHRLMRVTSRQQLVQPGGGQELDLFATQRLSPEQELVRAEHCREIASFVDELPARTASVLRARYFEEKTRTQVAEELNLSEKQVKRELENAMDALEAFVIGHARSEPCEFGRKPVTVYARGWAQGSVAAQARHHLTKCEQCRRFYGDFRSLRWGAAAAVPVPALASAPDHAPTIDKLTAAADWVRERVYSFGGRADPSALASIRGPGSAAAVATCVAIGTAGGATYCATQGIPEPVRDLLPGGSQQADSGDQRPDPKPAAQVTVPPPVEVAPAPTTSVEPPPTAPTPPAEPPPPEPEPQEFGFERTAPAGSADETSAATASASPSPAQSQPSSPAPAPESGGGEFAP